MTHSKLPERWQHLRPPNSTIMDFFATEPARIEQMQISGAGLTLDFCRQQLGLDDLKALQEVAYQAHLPTQISRLFNGEELNSTEHRAALHTALRAEPASEQVSETKQRMYDICRQFWHGERTGFSGEVINHVVNIGIGGSDLGPRMCTEALCNEHNANVSIHFVANLDRANIDNLLAKLPPARTAFIATSKSWSTEETLSNLTLAKQWLAASGCSEAQMQQHLIAVTASPTKAQASGVSAANILPMWDWVGGRFSLWSSVGMSIALATSEQTFEQLLAGARAMDDHVKNAPIERNLAITLALLELWNCNVLGHNNQIILPYSHNLRLLPNHLQQLVMESNGKSVNVNGEPLDYHTCPILWGSIGTVGQHSFHQLLHQGTRGTAVDFILPLTSHCGDQANQDGMIANCLAQAEVLMTGARRDEIEAQLTQQGVAQDEAHWLAKHKAMHGNQPSTLISFQKLDAFSLGALVALYEHRVFCTSVLWGINPFDQWGVELGKQIAGQLERQLSESNSQHHNPATRASLTAFLAATGRTPANKDQA